MASVTLDQLLYGIREVETGGMSESARYHVINSIGAVGAYQVMTANIASWTKQALGKSLTRDQFRNSKDAQDKVARYIIGKYYNQYGPEGAAAMWFSGQPNPNSGASDGGNTVRQYVNKAIAAAKKGTITGGASSGDDTSGGGVEQAGLIDSIIDWPGDIVDFFKTATDSMETVMNFFVAFFKPSTYVRIACGIFGFAFLVVSIVCFAREARTA